MGRIAVLLAAAVLASLAHGQGDAEFDSTAAPAVRVSEPAAAPPAAPPPARVAAPRDWMLEIAVAIAAVTYVACYVYGRQQNAQLTREFVDTYRPWLREQFSQTGLGADAPSASPLVKISDSSSEMWSSGRRNCLGLHITIALQPRQDLLSMVFGAVAPPQLAAFVAPGADVVTLECPVPAAAAPGFVFALYEKRQRKDFLESRKDVGALLKLRAKPSSQSAGLPDAFEVFSEGSEISEAILGLPCGRSSLRQLIVSHPRALRSLHYTDAAASAGFATATTFKEARVLRVELRLPAARSDWDAALGPFLHATLALVDALASLRLSKEASSRVAESRAALQRALDRDLQHEKDEAARRAREEKKKQEEAELSKLDRETRRKIEEKRRKEAMAKAMPKMKFKSG